MKNLLFIFLLFLYSCVPVKYVYIDPKDSVVRKQRVIYDNVYVDPFPFGFNNWYWFNSPFYYPMTIPRRQPIIINPKRPQNPPPAPIRKFTPNKNK
jgi:hypothetical protein